MQYLNPFLPNVPFLYPLKTEKPLSYRNQSIDLQSKSMDWFLYDNGFLLSGDIKRYHWEEMGYNMLRKKPYKLVRNPTNENHGYQHIETRNVSL